MAERLPSATVGPTVDDFAKRIEFLFNQRRYERALAEGASALALDPNAAGIHRQLAYCLSALGRHADAIASAERAVALQPDSAWSHRALAWMLMQADQQMRAVRAVNEAIRLDPGQPENCRIAALIAARRKRWQESLDAAERGLALNPASKLCALLRAQALLNLGEYRQAKQGAAAMLALHPEEAETHALLGLALNREGDRGSAERHLREAVRLAPDSAWIKRALRQVILEQHAGYCFLVKQRLRYVRRENAPGPETWRDRLHSLRLWIILVTIVAFAVGSAGFAEFVSGPIIAAVVGTYVLLGFVLPPLFKRRAHRHLRRHEIGRYLDAPPDGR